MDNKKWYNRVATCFWFFLATLPLWVAILQYIMQYIGVPEGMSTMPNFKSFFLITAETETAFRDFIPSFISNLFDNLCDILDENNLYTFYVYMAWFTWTYFLHLMVDFIVWLPKWFHNILDKGVGKID